MRYRDLETGTYLTRDPIGYADGPNVYCYVHCNPITRFDPLGLEINFCNPDESANDWAKGVWDDAKKHLSVDLVEKMESPSTTTWIAVMDDVKTVEFGFAQEDEKGSGNYVLQVIDKGDLLAAQDGTPATTESWLAHEVVEAYYLQNESMSFSAAHYQKGFQAESSITGWTRGKNGDWTKNDNGGRSNYILYTNPDNGRKVRVDMSTDSDANMSVSYTEILEDGSETPYVSEAESSRSDLTISDSEES